MIPPSLIDIISMTVSAPNPPLASRLYILHIGQFDIRLNFYGVYSAFDERSRNLQDQCHGHFDIVDD
jgi:hypothetical protein